MGTSSIHQREGVPPISLSYMFSGKGWSLISGCNACVRTQLSCKPSVALNRRVETYKSWKSVFWYLFQSLSVLTPTHACAHSLSPVSRIFPVRNQTWRLVSRKTRMRSRRWWESSRHTSPRSQPCNPNWLSPTSRWRSFRRPSGVWKARCSFLYMQFKMHSAKVLDCQTVSCLLPHGLVLSSSRH